MAWTDERIAKLSKLWDEGFSASQIAERLGEGVTRNAVIGKAHRLGLKSRPSPVKSAKGKGGRPAKKAKPAKPAKITLLDLTERMCKWPSGHPGDDDFQFCGKKAAAGLPYCEAHCEEAYQSQNVRKDRKATAFFGGR